MDIDFENFNEGSITIEFSALEKRLYELIDEFDKGQPFEFPNAIITLIVRKKLSDIKYSINESFQNGLTDKETYDKYMKYIDIVEKHPESDLEKKLKDKVIF